MSAPTDLNQRYGAPSVWRGRVLLGGVVVVVAAFLGWLGWTTWDQVNPEVESELISFDVLDPHTATARVQVRLRADDVEATCKLRAYAEDKNVVGEMSFTPPGSGTSVQEIRTEREATSVELLGCTAPGQNRPR